MHARDGRRRRTRVGAALWLAGVLVFFAAQAVAGAAWSRPAYSWSWNNVSDLGHVRCELWAEDGHGATYVCSPLHQVMNAGFVVAGLCLVVGTVLLAGLWRATVTGRAACTCFVLAGAGLAISGLVPADVAKHVHQGLGALALAVFANLGLLLSRAALRPALPAALGVVGTLLGLWGFAAFGLFLGQRYLGLGPGGMERAWAYGFLLWAAVTAGSVGWPGRRSAALATGR